MIVVNDSLVYRGFTKFGLTSTELLFSQYGVAF